MSQTKIKIREKAKILRALATGFDVAKSRQWLLRRPRQWQGLANSVEQAHLRVTPRRPAFTQPITRLASVVTREPLRR
jgi:hypothetical protein